MQEAKIAKNSPSVHHRTTLSGYIFATTMSRPHVLTIWWTSAHHQLKSVPEFGAPHQISTGFVLGSVTAWHSSSGRQPNFAAMNRGRHLYLAGRPSRLALAHILVHFGLMQNFAYSAMSFVHGLHNAHWKLHEAQLFLRDRTMSGEILSNTAKLYNSFN